MNSIYSRQKIMPKLDNIVGVKIHIGGIVQGVGFRPFVYTLAQRYQLKGWVRNTSAGVDIEATGSKLATDQFIDSINNELPPLAQIDHLEVKLIDPGNYSDFQIIHSTSLPGAFQPISPDISICPDCLRELFDPADRRFLYPFINCTNCGPRFTIIQDIPYDRPNTTMAAFEMCKACKSEYISPINRRFHAQPIACPECGPSVWLEDVDDFSSHNTIPSHLNEYTNDLAIYTAQYLLSQGKILAIKGLGGFHLACDATNSSAVDQLRQRKLRVDKPFAVMMPDIDEVGKHCFLESNEIIALESRECPIVILDRKNQSTISPSVAPGQNTIGVMLPYTPLHYLLFYDNYHQIIPETELLADFVPAKSLVMTSGNLNEEPIAIDNEEARQNLSRLADTFLMHDRPIHNRCDDSVVRVLRLPKSSKSESEINNNRSLPQAYPIRRSRGYAPSPIHLPMNAHPVFAAGAELKNTFCFTRDDYAFISHHIGDMENYETLSSYEKSVKYYQTLFRINPITIAYDLHPDYLASRFALNKAETEGLPAYGVQHHHAHVASCMAENRLPVDSQVIGISLDGSGYGDDGQIWGGEFLLAGYSSYKRLAHLTYIPLPGGDSAIRKPARIALAHLWNAGIDWEQDFPSVKELCVEERNIIRTQLEKGINAPLTSSMGRLFDAVAAIIGLRQEINYEAQAAIELEAIIDQDEIDKYPIVFSDPSTSNSSSGAVQIETNPIINSVAHDYLDHVSPSKIAARFHNTIAAMVYETSLLLRERTGTSDVVLSGGVWQNHHLMNRTLDLFNSADFSVYIHRLVPTNDGGLALGQAVIADQNIL